MRDIRNVLANGEPDELIEGVPLNEYLALPAISGSSLLPCRKSQLAARYHYEHQSATTDPMRFGAALDHLLFEHGVPTVLDGKPLAMALGAFSVEWPVIEGKRAGKAWLSPAERPAGSCPVHREHGVQYVKQDELPSLCLMLTAVCTDPVAARHWGAGTPQLTMLVTIAGLRVKMRPDWVCEEIVDLKTTHDVSDRSFTKTAWSLGYPLKMALYRYGYRQLTGKELGCSLVVAQSKDEPDVVVEPIDPVTLSLCEEKMLGYCESIRKAIETDTWPGVAGGEERPLEVPPWEMDEPEFVEVSDG